MRLFQQNIRVSGAVLLLGVLLTSCGGGSETATPDATDSFSATTARAAVLLGDINDPHRQISRPSAPLGVFVNLYMSGGGFLPATAAMRAVIAHAQFHAAPTEEQQDNTIALLQEFGTILQVDLNDLLNRSENRRETLDNYTEGLKNITERSRRRMAEMDIFLDQLRDKQTEQRRTVSGIERDIRNALREEDYTTAGSRQAELGDAEAELAKTQSELEQQQRLRRTYDNLLDIADERILAIDQNREILIAGLKVIDVPGAEDLGILEEEQRRGVLGF